MQTYCIGNMVMKDTILQVLQIGRSLKAYYNLISCHAQLISPERSLKFQKMIQKA